MLLIDELIEQLVGQMNYQLMSWKVYKLVMPPTHKSVIRVLQSHSHVNECDMKVKMKLKNCLQSLLLSLNYNEDAL